MSLQPYFEQNKNQSGLTDIDRPFYVGCQTTLHEGYQIASQITLETGFNHTSYFIKQFKRIKGVSPKRYRRERLQVTYEHLE